MQNVPFRVKYVIEDLKLTNVSLLNKGKSINKYTAISGIDKVFLRCYKRENKLLYCFESSGYILNQLSSNLKINTEIVFPLIIKEYNEYKIRVLKWFSGKTILETNLNLKSKCILNLWKKLRENLNLCEKSSKIPKLTSVIESILEPMGKDQKYFQQLTL